MGWIDTFTMSTSVRYDWWCFNIVIQGWKQVKTFFMNWQTACFKKKVLKWRIACFLNLSSPLSVIFNHSGTLIASFMGPIWGPSGAHRTQVGPMLAHDLCCLGSFYQFNTTFINRRMILSHNIKNIYKRYIPFWHHNYSYLPDGQPMVCQLWVLCRKLTM